MIYNFSIDKNITFTKDIYLTSGGVPQSLVGKKVRCIIKESYETDTILFDLTEANNGINVLDDAGGQISLYISAADLDITADFGVYSIVSIDETYPLDIINKLLDGKITFVKGTL